MYFLPQWLPHSAIQYCQIQKRYREIQRMSIIFGVACRLHVTQIKPFSTIYTSTARDAGSLEMQSCRQNTRKSPKMSVRTNQNPRPKTDITTSKLPNSTATHQPPKWRTPSATPRSRISHPMNAASYVNHGVANPEPLAATASSHSAAVDYACNPLEHPSPAEPTATSSAGSAR